MRTLISFVPFALGLTFACGDDQPGPLDASDTATTDAADATLADATDATVPADGTADATPDTVLDIAADATSDVVDVVDATSDVVDAVDADATGCAPVTCDLACPHGYREDAAGCEICACRECAEPTDCAGVIACDAPTCSDAGVCLCDCTGVAPVTYACPGVEVPFCACSDRGWSCMAHPELQCPTLCSPHTPEPWPCPDGATVPWCECSVPGCEPTCEHVGEADEGYYDGCTGDLVLKTACAGCQPVCQAIGSRSEGWYDSCGGGLIGWAFCGPRRDCAEDPGAACEPGDCTVETPAAPFVCPDGATVPHCGCDVPGAACPAVCEHVGSDAEGWYDGCSGALLRKAKCQDCTATCDAVGSKSEGWYSSCDGLITWAACATGTWTCEPQPWSDCVGPRACVGEGDGFIEPAADCCPGLTPIDFATWDGESCGFVDCLCHVCTQCGDGACDPPENPCNCARDCPVGAGPLPRGALCGSDAECASELTCLEPLGGGLIGVCTRVCTAGPQDDCGDGAVCTILEGFQAPGFCLDACQAAADCGSPLTCGSWDFGAGITPPSSCFFWPPCDPIADAGCGHAEQCRVVGGQPACGMTGDLERGDKCDRALDLCGPGLTCGAISQCWPVCADDDACRDASLDFCLKQPSGAPFGHCMFLE